MDKDSIRLDGLRAWLAFVDAGSFTAAARALHLSQPALFTRVRLLSEAIGRPLYRKVGRRTELTEAGREVEALARQVLGSLDRFSRARDGAPEPPPVVSAGRSTHLYLLAAPLRRWGRPLSLRAEDQAGTLESVRSGRADLGVAPLAEADPALRCLPLREVGSVAIVPQSDPLAGAKALSCAALADRALVLPPRGRPHREAVARAIGGAPRVVVEVDGWELMAHYAALGVGVAVVSELVPPPPGSVAVPIFDLPRLRVCLLQRRESASDAVEELAALLAREARTC